jgi:hypothetical protein
LPADVEEREGTDAGKCFEKCAERGRGRGVHMETCETGALLHASTLLFCTVHE